jgi:uncharacterized alpha-E superfamily protein
VLSRVAESLYWMARYIERAEDLTRALAVHLHALLDTPEARAEHGWRSLLTLIGDEEVYNRHFPRPDDAGVSEFFICHPGNPSSIVACIGRARENARGVREQISSEMWEHLNRLYFAVKDVGPADFTRGPYEFYRQVRDGSQTLQGITHATMTHGEAYQFIQLGKHLERAAQTVRLLGVRYAEVQTLQDGTAMATVQLTAMLKSVSAFEPFRQTPGSSLQAAGVAEFLLLHREFPRSVLFCLHRCAEALRAISPRLPRPAPPERLTQALGRMTSELDYLEIQDVLGESMDAFLLRLLRKIHDVGHEIARAYFNTQVILPSPRAQQGAQQQ